MDKFSNDKLLKEIAQYGERAYRRGLQHGVVFRVSEEKAEELRHNDYEHIYEIIGNPGDDHKFCKKSIYDRLKIEQKGDTIKEILSLAKELDA